MKKLAILLLLTTSPLVFAENVELSTGEVLDGKLIDFPKEVTIELSDGTKKKVPYQTINSIYKNAQPPVTYTPFLDKDKDKKKDSKGLDKSAEDAFEDIDASKGPYATPSHTFMTWKNAAMADNINGMADCYAVSRKSDVKKELKKIPKKSREEMKTAMAQTLFTANQPYYQGEFAIMEVTWTKGLASQTQTLKFTLENNKDWKIVE